jgi:hypothetical protein
MRKLILFCIIVLLPAVVVGISNFHVFPDSSWAATIMLVVTVGAAAVFTWQSSDATARIARYCICADFVIAAILCANLAAHWILAREVSAAKQGVVERHTEEDRDDRRAKERVERELELKKAEAELAAANAALQNAERRRLAQLPRSERRSSITAPKPEPTKPTQTPAPIVAPMSLLPGAAVMSASITSTPRLTPEQVRESWWWTLTALAIAEVAASVLAGAILAGIWEWDRNRDGIPDHLQRRIISTVEQIRQAAQRPQMQTIAERTFRILRDGRREVIQSTNPGEVGQIWPAERDAGAGAEPRP